MSPALRLAVVVGILATGARTGAADEPAGEKACLDLGKRVYAGATAWEFPSGARDQSLVDACARNATCAAGCESAFAAAAGHRDAGGPRCRELAHLEGPKLIAAAVRLAKRSLARARDHCGKPGGEAYDQLSCALAALDATGAADAACERTEARLAVHGLGNLARAAGDDVRGLVELCAELVGCAGTCGPALRGLAMRPWDQLDQMSPTEAAGGCRDLAVAFESSGAGRSPALARWTRERWQRELADVCPRLDARDRAAVAQSARALGLSVPEGACGTDTHSHPGEHQVDPKKPKN